MFWRSRINYSCNSFNVIMQSFALAVLLVFLSAGSPYAADLVGKAVGVSDGDTIALLTSDNRQYKIRLTGIDAPEKTQAFGQAAKRNLSALVYNKQVKADCIGSDRYKRGLCKIILNGTDVNLAQIKSGHAWHYKKYQASQSPADRATYANAEDAAKREKIGLWADRSPIPPWQYRKRPY